MSPHTQTLNENSLTAQHYHPRDFTVPSHTYDVSGLLDRKWVEVDWYIM
jgi:hypothetical protein